MRNHGIGSWPARRARRVPDAPAITFTASATNYRDLSRRVTRLANGLRAMGIHRGDRVALVSENHPACLEALFAAGLLGAVFVPVNARLTAAEITYVLDDAGATVLVHSPRLTDVARKAAAHAKARPQLLAIDADYEALIRSASDLELDEPVTDTDVCIIMYTSGTTGRPKGVVLTHGNVLMAVMNAVVDLDLHSDESALVCAPLFHAAALNMVALPTMLKGGRVVIADGFQPGLVLSAIESDRITFLFGVPTMLDALSSHPLWPTTDLSSVRRILVGAAPVPPRTLRTFTERGVTTCQGYGLTESGPGALVLTGADAARKIGTAGVPHFFTDVRIVTSEGEPAAQGERGEIQISGPHVMTSYWNRPDASDEAFTADGWLRSGDVGTADADGFVTIVDRLKDVIISGGENVYPAEVEAQLAEMPEIGSCAVFGIDDPRWGESPCAAVTLTDGATLDLAAISEFLTPRLARYKIPKQLVVLADLPLTATGKFSKHELRSQFGNQARQP